MALVHRSTVISAKVESTFSRTARKHIINLPHDTLGPLYGASTTDWFSSDARTDRLSGRSFQFDTMNPHLNYRGGIHGKSKGTSGLCVEVEGGENESGE